MTNHELDPKIYDFLVESGVIDPNKPLRPPKERITKQTRDQQHEVYITHELGPFAVRIIVLIVIIIAIAVGIESVYLLT